MLAPPGFCRARGDTRAPARAHRPPWSFRPSVSRDCGALRPRTQLLFVLSLAAVAGTFCSAVAMFTAFLLHLNRVSLPKQASFIPAALLTRKIVSELLAVPGPEAPDDRALAESHVEPGKHGPLSALTLDRPLWKKSDFSPIFQAPQKHEEAENGRAAPGSNWKSKECNGAPLLSERALRNVRDDLQLHLCLSALFTLPLVLLAPSLIHWSRNLR